jgi:A/G-specific adenine glycosylase
MSEKSVCSSTRPTAKELLWIAEESASYGYANRARFPWRKKQSAYRIFVAEFMLQRTGAGQVAPRYVEFLDTYPSLQDLVRGRKGDIVTRVAALGLRHRAETLWRCLEAIRGQNLGRLPTKEERLLALPGIGRYTARAILCFGRGKQVGVVDPNTFRVLSRVAGLQSTRARSRDCPDAWEAADALAQLDGQNAKFVNWGLIDIGRDFCKKQPRCRGCPLEKRCDYRRTHAGS